MMERIWRTTRVTAAYVATVLVLVLVFLVLVVLTDGWARGWLAWGVTAAIGLAVAGLVAARGRSRRGLHMLARTGVAVALTASVCVPSVPTTWQYPPDLPGVATEHWTLPTGSRVAV